MGYPVRRFRGFGDPVGMDPMNAQSYKTQRPESPEDLWQPLYDRVQYPAAGQQTIAFFTIPKGQAASLIVNNAIVAAKIKTYRDTNLEQAGVIPTKLFKWVGISLAFIHQVENAVLNPPDRDRLRNGGFLKIRIVDKDIMYLPLTQIPEMNPYVIASTTANNTTILGMAGGGGANVSMYTLPVPITLNPYENFTVTMDFDGPVTPAAAVDIMLILHAFMRRPT